MQSAEVLDLALDEYDSEVQYRIACVCATYASKPRHPWAFMENLTQVQLQKRGRDNARYSLDWRAIDEEHEKAQNLTLSQISSRA